MTQENKIHFPNNPVVEIIAELKWGKPTFTPPPEGTNQHLHLFDRFTAQLATEGYNQVVRLVPSNYPSLPFQPVYRYRTKSDTSLFQIGSAMFSANVTPPDHSWEQFSPVIEKGITSLFASLDNKETITNVSLRYINAFGDDLTRGKKIMAFLSEMLNFRFDFPEGLQELAISADDIKPQIQLVIPLRGEQQMVLLLGEGMFNHEKIILMDINVARMSEEPLQTIESVMETLNLAHKTIHNLLVKIISKLYTLTQGN